jgi:hypothetical protein
LRVAYLIDLATANDELLDAILAEAYGRWGGRRTLIVPATADGIDPRYDKWLYFYDPDIIYSYIQLSDAAVAAIHEGYGPAHLRHHRMAVPKGDTPPRNKPELSVNGLSSLSVIPALLSRPWTALDRLADPRVLSKFWDRSESPFLAENFGFLSNSFQPLPVSGYPELFRCLTLITQEALENPQWGKDSHAEYVTSEIAILEALAERRPLLTLASLSEVLAPYLETAECAASWQTGLSLIIGDSLEDRLLFWNGHHRYETPWFGLTTALRITSAQAADPDFLGRLTAIIRHRAVTSFRSNNSISLRSATLEPARLEEVAALLRAREPLLGVHVPGVQGAASCIPEFGDFDSVRFIRNIGFQELETRQTTEIRDRRIHVPASSPWHMREALPPAPLRQGNWMIDLWIDRLNDHCRYANERHSRLLPRRLRLDRAFKLERQKERSLEYEFNIMRVLRVGCLALPQNLEQGGASITVPDDMDAFVVGLCTDFEWRPFERFRQGAPAGRKLYLYAELSDKGRYQLGVLDRFASVSEAFDVLMNGYWRDVLLSLAAVPAEKNAEPRDQLIMRLRRRLGQPQGALSFNTPEDVEKLAREAIRIGRQLQREARYVEYKSLKRDWNALVGEAEKEDSAGDDETNAYYRGVQHLDNSIKYLCQQDVLYQGVEWRCRRCFNRNWVTINSISRTLACEVCRHEEPAPVSHEWHFRANGFVIEAYRDHGVEAVIYVLFQLWQRAKNSFYFVPSLNLWNDYPDRPAAGKIEIDALAVVDGVLYLCEAKNSGGLSTNDKAKLTAAAERIRPNTFLLVCMDVDTTRLSVDAGELRRRIARDISVEVMGFEPGQLRRAPVLPY